MVRKIKFILFAVVAIFMVSFIPNVYAADENYYELKLYEKSTLPESSSEVDVELLLLEFLTTKEDLVQLSFDQNKVMTYNLDNKLLFTVDYSSNSNGIIEIADGVTFQDNIEYKFTNDEKMELEEYCSELSDYSGVKWMFAEEPKECNSVCIEGVELDSKSDKAKILSEPKYQDLIVKFDIKFKELNDYVKYKIVINNATSEDYMISEKNNFGNSPYITYEYSYEGSARVAKKNSKTVMYITIKYGSKVPDEKFTNGIFTEENNFVIVLDNNKGALDVFKNPNTGHNLLAIGIIFLVVIGLSLVLYKTTAKKKYLSVFIIGLLLLPIGIYSMEKIQITVESKIQIAKGDLNQFSLYNACSVPVIVDYYKGYQYADHYQYEEGMTWKEWEASEYNVDHRKIEYFVAPKYILPELIECHKQIKPNSNGDRPENDLRACENNFGSQSFNSASLIVSEGLHVYRVPCPK